MVKQSDYPVGFYFKLTFKEEDIGFQEVSGISKEIGVEEVVSGGENRLKYRLPKTFKFSNLVLKRGIVAKNSQLFKWCVSTIEEGLIKAIVINDFTVSLLDKDGLVLKEWTFHDAYPVKYSVSDLSPDPNAIAIESLAFAYSYFEIL
ncbi:phage tail protein [Lacinutrix himadriensis]|uniref:phage tail protein n=1 Tax=Lacinutrix himadriensis TaxID=641549 RepID=UPI0006E2D709|nr:phage tail protein [Lacinutrix himadriensis]